MKKFVLGRGATKRIVKRGTPIKRDGRQTIKKAERAKRLNNVDNRLATGRIEALGEEPHYYVVRDSETDALVDVYDPIGYGTLAGITLLVGQFIVYDYSETLKFHVILNASPL